MYKHVSHQRVTNPQNRDVNAGQRASLAVKLRAAKLTYEQIAAQTGYSNASACRKAILRELDRTIVKNIDELRIQELSMLDQLHTECWKLVMDKNNERGKLWAVDRVLAISERRAKLMGLDLSTDAAIAAAQIIVQEVPQGYLSLPAQTEVTP